MAKSRLELSRSQILGFRRQVGSLERRLPFGTNSLRRAAWAGLQDSTPRAALLSIHARVNGIGAATWEHPSLVQLWGPRFSTYVVAEKDLAIFSLGRLPQDVRGYTRAYDTASRLRAFLNGRRMQFGQAGRGIGVHPNSLRYAAATGTVLLHWDAAHQPVVWTRPAPRLDPQDARLELARRYLHVFGPASATSFARWAGIGARQSRSSFDALSGELTPVRVPTGDDAWILAEDEECFRTRSGLTAATRFLPSGDAYFLLWGADREVLVPDANQRSALWTTRAWPGALLLNGQIVGVWRRAAGEVSIEVWRRLSREERNAVEAEASTLPLPGLSSAVGVRWT